MLVISLCCIQKGDAMSLSVEVGVLREVFVIEHVPVNQLPIAHLCYRSPCIMYRDNARF